MKYCLYCIIQPGELEIQALALLCSIRRRMLGEYSLFACFPDNLFRESELQYATVKLLSKLDIPLIPFNNPYLSGNGPLLPGDAFSNKYFALDNLPCSDFTIFMDSDMLMIRDLEPDHHFPGADFLAKTVCFMNESRWEALYGIFDTGVPTHRIRSTVDGKEGPPYFNGGLFCIDSDRLVEFRNTWYETFTRITRSGIMQDNPVNREQVALAISVFRMQLTYRCLTEELNFPARSRQLRSGEHPFILHYHDPESIYKTSVALREFRSLMESHSELRSLAGKMGNWKMISEPPVNLRWFSGRLKARLKAARQSWFHMNRL